MKEKYSKPVSYVQTFAMADVVTTSAVGGNGGEGPIELPDFEL